MGILPVGLELSNGKTIPHIPKVKKYPIDGYGET